MKKYIQKSLMLSAIICIIVTLVSFLCFEYRDEMKLNFLIVIMSFLGMGIHYFTSYIFYDSFLKELICKYFCFVAIPPLMCLSALFSSSILETYFANWLFMSFNRSVMSLCTVGCICVC